MENPIDEVHFDREVTEVGDISTESSDEILAAQFGSLESRPVPELTQADFPRHSFGTPRDFWTYRNETGGVLGAVARFDLSGGKEIRPLNYDQTARSWAWAAFWSGKRPLYGLERLTANPHATVLLVEGEKTTDAAQKHFPEHVAMTWGPAGVAATVDLVPLAGRSVVIFPDNDEAGRNAARVIAQRLLGELKLRSAKLVRLPESLPEKWDLADEVPEGIDIHALVTEAPEVKPPNDDDEVLVRLAALSSLEYDRQREGEAERLGIRVSTLDMEVKRIRAESQDERACGFGLTDPRPWDKPVVGAELLDELTEVAKQHLALPVGAAEAVALWTLHSHAHETATISPILAVTSPAPECGKTTLLTLLQALTRRPVATANITAAALFRTVEKWQPTLIIDEGDTFLRNSDELRGILNSGHNRYNAYVIRTTGDDHEPRHFKTWSPKAIALIGKLPPTLESRAIHVELQRMDNGEIIEPLRTDKLGRLEPLRQKAWRWTCDNRTQLAQAEPDMPPSLQRRNADNWRHLLAIADLAGGEWPQKARQVAATLSAGREGNTDGITLLEDLRRIFEQKGADRLSSAVIVTELGAMDDRPWPEWKGKQITPAQLAKLLAPFKIKPGSIRLSNVQSPKGYYLKSFDVAFRRYLPAREAATPPQPAENNAFIGNHSRYTNGSDHVVVADEPALKPVQGKACVGVADAQAVAWEEEL